MKRKHYRHIVILLLSSTLLYSCGQNISDSDSKGGNDMEEIIEYYPANVIGPTKDLTLEEQIEGVQTAYDNVYGFYTKMQDLANADGVGRKEKKAAAKIEKEYADRLEELGDMDFSQMTSGELLSLSLELTDMSSEIRKVLDLLAAD